MELLQAAAEDCAAAIGGADVHHEVPAVLHAGPLAWWLRLGYFFVAAPAIGGSFGLADTPAAALVAYALLLLGAAFIGIAMLPLRPMERLLREEDNGAVGNGNRQGIIPRARGMDWTGYFFVAAPVLASCAGFVDGLPAALFSYALLLLGLALIIIAMLAMAKPHMD